MGPRQEHPGESAAYALLSRRRATCFGPIYTGTHGESYTGDTVRVGVLGPIREEGRVPVFPLSISATSDFKIYWDSIIGRDIIILSVLSSSLCVEVHS